MAWYDIKHEKRIRDYQMYEDFYHNKYSEELKRLSDVDASLYIAINIVKTISHITPDFLFGTAPRINVEEAKKGVIDAITASTKFNSKMYKSSLTSTVKGDAAVKLYLRNNKVGMQVIQPGNFFPVYDAYEELIEATIAIPIKQDNKNYLLKEIHTPEGLTRVLYLLDDKNEVVDEYPLTALQATKDLAKEEKNPIGMMTIIHIPNFSQLNDSQFGLSDFHGEKELLLALNQRISEIHYIVSKHADPKIAVPEDMIQTPDYSIIETDGTKIVTSDIDHKDFKMVGVKNGDPEPKYIHVDLSQLSQAFSELDRLISYILMDTETSPALLSRTEDGGRAESGKALKLRLMNTIRKINRKKAYYTEAIQEIFLVSQKLLDNNAEAAIVDVEFIDSITTDQDELIEKAVKLFDKGLISHKEALRTAFPGTEESVIDSMILDVVDDKLRNAKLFKAPIKEDREV